MLVHCRKCRPQLAVTAEKVLKCGRVLQEQRFHILSMRLIQKISMLPVVPLVFENNPPEVNTDK